jgi:hypothetical protein
LFESDGWDTISEGQNPLAVAYTQTQSFISFPLLSASRRKKQKNREDGAAVHGDWRSTAPPVGPLAGARAHRGVDAPPSSRLPTVPPWRARVRVARSSTRHDFFPLRAGGPTRRRWPHFGDFIPACRRWCRREDDQVGPSLRRAFL